MKPTIWRVPEPLFMAGKIRIHQFYPEGRYLSFKIRYLSLEIKNLGHLCKQFQGMLLAMRHMSPFFLHGNNLFFYHSTNLYNLADTYPECIRYCTSRKCKFFKKINRHCFSPFWLRLSVVSVLISLLEIRNGC